MAARLFRLSSPSSSSSLPLVSANATTTASSARRPRLPSNNSLFRLQQLRRTMAAAAPKTEWLVVVPDFPNTIAKRLEVRPYVLSPSPPSVHVLVEPGANEWIRPGRQC